MKFYLTIFLVLSYIVAFAQDCNCLDEFRFIKAHMEKNHGGFNKKIKSASEPAYKSFTDKLEKEIAANPGSKYCIALLKKYILYLQDHHSNISGSGMVVKEDSAAAVEAFFKSPVYQNTESIQMDENELLEKAKSGASGIEGIYFIPDSTYVVAVIKAPNQYRDYAGVILSSKTKLWSKGQVKFELKQVNDTLFDFYSYLRNHSLNYEQVDYSNGQLQLNGWVKAGAKPLSKKPAISNELISFTILDSLTTMLSIRSFSASLYNKLDSAYQQVLPIIREHPYLIIDIRNNGGGSDMSYKALMPLIFTDPFESDVVEIYNTPGNIKAYQDFDDRQKQIPGARQDVFKANIEKMNKAEPYSFVPMGNGKPATIKYQPNSGKLKKVAVLYNRFCASSCESFLFEVMNSKKTIMVGENSGGYTGFGNVMSIQTPCGNQLSWTTTVYRNQWRYEFVGIPPQYRVPDTETDWVEYTRKLLRDE